MCPTIYTMDNGELILAAYGLELAHPTGYPLFCVLGKIFTSLIPFGTIAWRINAMNAIISAAGIGILFLALSEVARKQIALFIALFFAVSPLFWDTAASAEVHGLSALLISLELLLFLLWRRTRDRKLLCYLALTAGFAATNHMISMLIMPGLLLGILLHDRRVIRDWPVLLKSLVLFLLPLSLYLYLPIRAEASRGSIWGDFYAAYGFWGHVTGRLFQSQMLTLMPVVVKKNSLAFLKTLIGCLPPYLIWILPAGFAALLGRRHGKLLWPLVTVITLNIAYAMSYQIPDIEQYFIPTMLVLSVIAAAGLDYVIERLRTVKMKTAAAYALAGIVLATGIVRLPTMNKHNAHYIMDFAQNIFETLDKDALFIACGDSAFNAMRYAIEIEGKRPDVIMLQRDIMRGWIKGSAEWTARYYYDTVSESSPAMRAFRWPSGYSRSQVEYEEFLNDVIAAAIKERPVYIACTGNNYRTHPILRLLKDEYRLLPEGILFRLRPKSEEVDMDSLIAYNDELWRSYKLRRIYDGSIRGSKLDREIPFRYAAFHVTFGHAELEAQMYAKAEENYRKALLIDRNMYLARNGLALALACQAKYAEALEEWQKVLAVKPTDRTALRGVELIRNMPTVGTAAEVGS